MRPSTVDSSPSAAGLTDGPDDGLLGAVIEVEVGPVAHGGHCVARAANGQVVFVRHTLPGERVRARVTEEHPGYLRADAFEILQASTQRRVAPCPYATRCGGCDFQHAEPAYQRELKAMVVREQLVRLGGLSEAEIDALELSVRPAGPLPGEAEGLGWRTRVQYTVDSTDRAGLLAHRSHEVVPIDKCIIAHRSIRAADTLARRWPDARTIEVISGDEPTVHDGQTVVSGSATITERAVGREWRLSPTAFWQVHPAAPQLLAATVVEFLEPRPGDRIWDLYGGAGLFAAALAPHADATGRVTVVEADQVAAVAAATNLADLTTVTIVQEDVGRALRNPRWRSVDLVVLDPPRAGAGPAVCRAIAERQPRAVAYVACDPAAFARDVRAFRTQGYGLARLQAYDLFPNTHHVECVGLLTPM